MLHCPTGQGRRADGSIGGSSQGLVVGGLGAAAVGAGDGVDSFKDADDRGAGPAVEAGSGAGVVVSEFLADVAQVDRPAGGGAVKAPIGMWGVSSRVGGGVAGRMVDGVEVRTQGFECSIKVRVAVSEARVDVARVKNPGVAFWGDR